MSEGQVLATFFGDEEFPIEWEAGQRELFWVHDDLHIPNPVSPMYADIGGWWLKCDYMFRRFGTPFASDWIVKIINGYVYTAAIPPQVGLHAEAEAPARTAGRLCNAASQSSHLDLHGPASGATAACPTRWCRGPTGWTSRLVHAAAQVAHN